jgi:hypothetical protein
VQYGYYSLGSCNTATTAWGRAIRLLQPGVVQYGYYSLGTCNMATTAWGRAQGAVVEDQRLQSSSRTTAARPQPPVLRPLSSGPCPQPLSSAPCPQPPVLLSCTGGFSPASRGHRQEETEGGRGERRREGEEGAGGRERREGEERPIEGPDSRVRIMTWQIPSDHVVRALR